MAAPVPEVGADGARAPDSPVRPAGSAREVFQAALGLGLTSFGGPIAHIGYFQRAYVGKRRWLGADEFAGMVALCQLVPGPASSQLGFLIGFRRAGWLGAVAAWLGFTLPSALLMFGFAVVAPRISGPFALAAFHGLKLVAVAVVAQAVWSMARTMCADLPRAAIALASALTVAAVGGPSAQMFALAIGGAGGVLLCRNIPGGGGAVRLPISARAGVLSFGVFVALLLCLPVIGGHGLAAMMAVFYRAGALVFGGGHVVLPLLRDGLVPDGWITDSAFLAGYGAAQAVPGPLFTFAAYLGAAIAPQGHGLGLAAAWSAAALGALFLPGLLVAIAGVPIWNWVSRHGPARGALAGVNAAVVGVLGAALYDPLWTSAILRPVDLAIAAGGFVLLQYWRVPPVIVVGCIVALSIAAR